MTQDQHIYRSADGVIGGVCGGLAVWLDMDAALVRLIAILLTLVTGGLVVVMYLAAWAILPKESQQRGAVDVDPAAFQSEMYAQVVNRSSTTGAASARASSSAAYMPPVPPPAAASYTAAHAMPGQDSGSAGQPQGGFAHAAAAHMPGSYTAAADHQTHTSYATTTTQHTTASSSRRPVYVGLVIGVTFIVAGAAALLSLVFGSATVFQFWPLAVVAAGIVRIVVPCKDGTRTLSTWLGALLVLVGLVALPTTLGVYTVDAGTWIGQSGPFLVIAAGLFIMGHASKSQLLTVLAALALALFCMVGAYFGYQESQFNYRDVRLPFDHEYILDWNDQWDSQWDSQWEDQWNPLADTPVFPEEELFYPQPYREFSWTRP